MSQQVTPLEQSSEIDLLTLSEFAALCRKPEETIRYWRKTGYGPKGFRLGRSVVYDRREVHAFIAFCRSADSDGAA